MKLKRLYGIIPRVKNMVKFRLEKFVLGGAGNQFFIIAVIIFLISMAAGYIHYRLYPETALGDAVWWAFLRLTDPGYLGDDQGAVRRFISTLLTVMGYVIFLGSLVAIMTQWLNRGIKNLELGLTRIYHRGHVLIIGWSDKTPIMVQEILLAEERVSNFLKMIRKGKLNIVVLAKDVSPAIVYELKTELDHLWERRLVTFRSGIPLRIEHLDRVDFLNAGVIILPGADIYEDSSLNSDTNIVKTLMTISHYAEERGVRCPDCVTEISDPDKISVLLSSYRGRLNVISGGLMITRLMAQVMRNRGMSRVYSELLKNDGNEIYLRSAAGFGGAEFMNMRKAFSRSILLGILRVDGDRTLSYLNPDPGMKINEDDELVVLAKDYGSSAPGHDIVFFDGDIKRSDSPKAKRNGKKVLLVGWNSKASMLAHELGTYPAEEYDVDLFSVVPLAERENRTGAPARGGRGVLLNHIMGDPTRAADLHALDLSLYDTVILLASDRTESGEESDARTIMAFMFLREIFKAKDLSPHVIVELHDPDNDILLREMDCEIIIPSHIISYALTQVALKRNLRVLYDRLFSSEGAEIEIKDPALYDLLDSTATFEEIEDAVYRYGEIVIGIALRGNNYPEYGYLLNPPKDRECTLSAGDKLIVLSG